MICPNCGNELQDGSYFCFKCGMQLGNGATGQIGSAESRQMQPGQTMQPGQPGQPVPQGQPVQQGQPVPQGQSPQQGQSAPQGQQGQDVPYGYVPSGNPQGAPKVSAGGGAKKPNTAIIIAIIALAVIMLGIAAFAAVKIISKITGGKETSEEAGSDENDEEDGSAETGEDEDGSAEAGEDEEDTASKTSFDYPAGQYDRVDPPEDAVKKKISGTVEDYYDFKDERDVKKINDLMTESYNEDYFIPGTYDMDTELVNIYYLAENDDGDYAIAAVYNILYDDMQTPVPGYNLFIAKNNGKTWKLSQDLNGDISFDDDWTAGTELEELNKTVEADFYDQAASDDELKTFLKDNGLYDAAGLEKLYEAEDEPGVKYTTEEFYNKGLEYYVNDEDDKALSIFQELADDGHAAAQFRIGMMYHGGYGVDQDFEKALEWYHKSADQGFAMAENNIGVCYLRGYGVDQDDETAMEWFNKAASSGVSTAQYNMGCLYRDGQGVEQDYEAAAEWFQKAADQDYAWALNDLGVMYYEGTGVEQDKDKAKELISEAADLGLEAAQTNLKRLF